MQAPGTNGGASVHVDQAFPFDLSFQMTLVRVLCEDDAFAHVVAEHLRPKHFESEVLAWAYSVIMAYREQYGTSPSIVALRQHLRQLDPNLQPVYDAVLEQVSSAPLRDELWLRDAVLDFVRRNIFVDAYQASRELYNGGKVTAAYDLMMGRMERLFATTFEPVEGEWLMEGLPARQARRLRGDVQRDKISTGFHSLDRILYGGMNLGDLGVWIGPAKRGKSTMLLQHGLAAARFERRKVWHATLENSVGQVLDRYDTAFTEEFYASVKFGNITSAKYQRLWEEYQTLPQGIYVRGLRKRWNYTIIDLEADLERLRREHNWVPDLLVVDYGDLIGGHGGSYFSEESRQRQGYRDLKTLAGRGYVIWTASQAQRPGKGSEDRVDWLRASEIADCWQKVCIADFIGSINATTAEKNAGVARLLYEYLRDGPGNVRAVVQADIPRMRIRETDSAHSPSWTPEAGAAYQAVQGQV